MERDTNSRSVGVGSLVRKIDQQPSLPTRELYKVLVTLRQKYVDEAGDVQAAIDNGVISKLVPLLKRPNSKIVDVVLSTLGNLMLHEEARTLIREDHGLQTLVNILSNLSEESILGRACRVVANAAQNHANAKTLRSLGLVLILVKTLNEVKGAKAKTAAVRAIRIVGGIETKENLMSSNAVAAISSQLSSDDEDLLKATIKCLAKFTSYKCDGIMATQIQGEGEGFQNLVKLAGHENKSIWEHAIVTLVNLSNLDFLRPNLGNVGTISVFIDKVNSKELPKVEAVRCVRALCLYCRESVNRMKLRNSGGLRLFVSILRDTNEDPSLQDKVIKSLMQFAYDDLGLKVLQQEGLVPSLVTFMENYISKNHKEHSCEETICESDNEAMSCESNANDLTKASDSFAKEPSVNYEPEQPMVNVESEDDKDSPVLSEVEEEEEGDTPGTEAERESLPDERPEASTYEPSFNKSSDQAKQYRIDSPSYREVQDEFEAFSRLRGATATPGIPGSSWSSAQGHSAGLSPLYSRSPSESGNSSPYYSSYQSSPSGGCYSPGWCSSSGGSSPISLPDDRDGEVTYSPIEYFSEEDDEEQIRKPEQRNASTSRSSSFAQSPDSKRSKLSPTVPLFQPVLFHSYPAPMKKSSGQSQHEQPEESQMSIILQVLSRLAQSEVPHEHLCSLSTAQALIRYLCWTKNPSTRAGRVLIKLSKNLNCLMPYVYQRTLSWLRPEIESRPTMKDSPCKDCLELQALSKELVQNFSLLAETGYSEGVMCHTLVKGVISDKQSVAIAVPLLVRPRKLLTNILITHEGLDVLLDLIEKVPSDEEDILLHKDAIYSLSILSGHIGIVSPNLKMATDNLESNGALRCLFSGHEGAKDLTIQVDDGRQIEVNREMMAKNGGVFEAMLTGGHFAESSQSVINLPFTSFQALTCLVHHMYGCTWCSSMSGNKVDVLLELASLTDKYLLNDFNAFISAEIVRRCMNVQEVVTIYEASLQKEYPIKGLGQEDNLNLAATSYILVGDMASEKRAEVFRELLKSRMASDFMDDVSRTIRSKLPR